MSRILNRSSNLKLVSLLPVYYFIIFANIDDRRKFLAKRVNPEIVKALEGLSIPMLLERNAPGFIVGPPTSRLRRGTVDSNG